MARTRWPPGPVNPGLLPGQADQTGSAGGCHNLGPGRQIVSKDSPSAASADSEVRPGPRPPTLRPNRHTTQEAGPEALPTSSLPIICWSLDADIWPGQATDHPDLPDPSFALCRLWCVSEESQVTGTGAV